MEVSITTIIVFILIIVIINSKSLLGRILQIALIVVAFSQISYYFTKKDYSMGLISFFIYLVPLTPLILRNLIKFFKR
jgi:hypothetical protein